jgi:N-acetyl-anhydromuramyl-L-alanine amidase AmpD
MDIIENLLKRDLKTNNNKTQIVITHTSRNKLDYLQSLKYRLNKNYGKVPHYMIDRDGKVVKLLEDNFVSNYFSVDKTNKDSIIISLENLGWLEKQPLKNHYINWIGNIYNEKPFERKWRDYFYWQPYTDEQILKTANLCVELSKKYNINLKCIGHNTKLKGSEKFMGILTESNFDELSTRISPAFDFEKFEKNLKNE